MVVVISEVTARFTLDAMPGKQMAIDADLNAGLIDQDTARTRREEVRQEADFYGAMDGASKFVRGDAVAGLLILAINIIGGVMIGTMQHELSFGQAFEVYALLTIGDGLVAQIPSLLLSTTAAIMVTRVSDAEDMGTQVSNQMFWFSQGADSCCRSVDRDGSGSRNASYCFPRSWGLCSPGSMVYEAGCFEERV